MCLARCYEYDIISIVLLPNDICQVSHITHYMSAVKFQELTVFFNGCGMFPFNVFSDVGEGVAVEITHSAFVIALTFVSA